MSPRPSKIRASCPLVAVASTRLPNSEPFHDNADRATAVSERAFDGTASGNGEAPGACPVRRRVPGNALSSRGGQIPPRCWSSGAGYPDNVGLGWSVLAAHLVLDREDYLGDGFDRRAQDLVDFAQFDLRGRIVRRAYSAERLIRFWKKARPRACSLTTTGRSSIQTKREILFRCIASPDRR